MHTFRDLTGASGIEVIHELGLQRVGREPFLRNEAGRIVAFRAQFITQDTLSPSSELRSEYGCGAYFASTPFGTVQFTGSHEADGFGVAAYQLPPLREDEIAIKRLRIGTDKGSHKLAVFPMPWLSRLQNVTEYPDSRISNFTEQWMLLRAATALYEMKEQTTRIAWLGKNCLGKPRWPEATDDC